MTLHQYRCETCEKYKWNGCIALAKDTSLIHIVGCASHSSYKSERDLALDELYNALKYGGIHMLVERLDDFHKGDKS